MRQPPAPPPGYTVGSTWSTDLEPGSWFEICYADKRRAHLIAGFVFIPYCRPSGGVDPKAVWDFREVDGSRIPRLNMTLKGQDRMRREAMLAGFGAAVEDYRAQVKAGEN